MSDDRATQTVSVSRAKDPFKDKNSKKKPIKVDFSIANLSRRYKIGDVIGSGGNSTVVEAYDRDLKRSVAVKLLKAKYQKSQRAVGRFLNEARITAMLQHPGVVPVYEVGYMGNKDFFFSMKKVDGHTLRDILNEKDRGDLFDTFYTVCETMAFAHDKGITHRDLKPENIMVEKYGSILIMDWGLAKNVNESQDESFIDEDIDNRFDVNESIELTMTGEISGTPSYMSPEQALGMMNKLNQRSDVFSMGIILYEIITGKNPFSENCEENFRKIFEAIKHKKPDEIVKDFRGKSVRKELIAICMKCLEKLPDDRYPDAKELYNDLRRFRENRPVEAYRTGVSEEISKWVERKRKILVVVLTIIALTVLTYFYKRTSEAEIAGVMAAIDKKIAAVEQKDATIAKTKERFNSKTEETVNRLISSHQEQRLIEWHTAKNLILYLMNNRKSTINPEYLIFLKNNWLREIEYYLEKSFLYEADRSLTEFTDFINDTDMALKQDENKALKSYSRILGKQQGGNNAGAR